MNRHSAHPPLFFFHSQIVHDMFMPFGINFLKKSV